MISNFLLEVCANSAESAFMAQEGGAQRVELCSNLYEGGTTPSYGEIKICRKKLTIDLHVLIRPRSGDFYYSQEEFEIMKEDILVAQKLGVDGIVIGLLNPNGSVDVKRTEILVDLARPMSVTFHRAFDVAKDPFQALEDIVACGCHRILTSGQKDKVSDGLDLVHKLIVKATNRIIIMPGSGVDEMNIQNIQAKTGANEFHASLRNQIKSKMIFKKNEVHMKSLSQPNEDEISVTDPNRVKKAIELIQNFKENLLS